MRTKSRALRRRIVDAGYDSFWRSGYTRSNVAAIAARAGVTKRTLYGHFRSKDDLLAAVLEHYDEFVMQRLDRIGAPMPKGRTGFVESFFGQLAVWASTTPRWTGSGLTRLVMELADLPGHPARVMARRSKATTETWVVQRLAAARVRRPAERARELMLLMEGAMALTLIHGDRRYIAAAARAAKKMLK
jgi:AcrR family transcriptional regulator